MFLWFCIKLNKIIKTINIGLNTSSSKNNSVTKVSYVPTNGGKNNMIKNGNKNSNNSNNSDNSNTIDVPSKVPQFAAIDTFSKEIEIVSDEEQINTPTTNYSSDSNTNTGNTEHIDIPDTINENINYKVSSNGLGTKNNSIGSNSRNASAIRNTSAIEEITMSKRKTENDVLFLELSIKLCVLSFVAMFTTWIAVISFAFVDASIGTSIDIVFNS